MHIERKNIDRSAILRGMRAIAGIEQREAAHLAGISLRTVASAEKDRCTNKTWRALVAVYEAHGVRPMLLPLYGDAISVVLHIDCDASTITE